MKQLWLEVVAVPVPTQDTPVVDADAGGAGTEGSPCCTDDEMMHDICTCLQLRCDQGTNEPLCQAGLGQVTVHRSKPVGSSGALMNWGSHCSVGHFPPWLQMNNTWFHSSVMPN